MTADKVATMTVRELMRQRVALMLLSVRPHLRLHGIARRSLDLKYQKQIRW
jgi:hypothetical protein